MRRILLIACFVCWSTSLAQAEEVDFERDVRPILADKCFRCHGPDEGSRESGLRLDRRDAALAPADSGSPAIVAGEPENSELVRRIWSDDDSEKMPPPDSNLVLSTDQKQRISDWIAAGAPYAEHWSLRPLNRPAPPAVKNTVWPENALDQFVLARLESEGLLPSVPADRYRLVRRVYLDLIGLPPTPEEADAFVNDTRPDAYQRLVDRLLDHPAFGERMAWPWLDAARYADSNGYQGDSERTMWPWRDWVVSALNRNLPFDQFTVWQIAGDRLPEASFEQRLATGFLRNHMINGEGGRIPEENRVEYVFDMAETVGTVWLGLTLNCCRCHDHKFDPLLRRDYYSMFAFFNQTPVDGGGGNPQTPPVLEVPSREQQRSLEELNNELDRLRESIEKHEQTLAMNNDKTHRADAPPPPPAPIPEIFAQKLDERTDEQLGKLETFFASAAPEYVKQLAEWRDVKNRRKAVRDAVPRVMIMEDRAELRPTFMLERGLYSLPGEEVSANVPERLPDLSGSRRDRLALAEWIVADENPLTARVVVNRYWQHFFGVGLVKTSEDFGTQGELPSHPELLDWLAVEFRESGWNVKHLCRLIVCSATYQQTSKAPAEQYERDPENRLLSRGARYRLPSWMIRDQALRASGLLVSNIGGAPVHPYQPAGVWEEATFGNKSYPQDQGAALYRRSIYTFWRRIVAPTMFFDVASRQTCTVKQPKTNTPLHALTTLNDITYVETGRVLAQQILHSHPNADPDSLVTQLFRRILVRPPSSDELAVLTTMLGDLQAEFAGDSASTDKFLSVGDSPRDGELDAARLAALSALANALFNLDETLSRE